MKAKSEHYLKCLSDLQAISSLNLRLSIDWHKDAFRAKKEYMQFITSIKDCSDSISRLCGEILKMNRESAK